MTVHAGNQVSGSLGRFKAGEVLDVGAAMQGENGEGAGDRRQAAVLPCLGKLVSLWASGISLSLSS